MTRDRHIYRRCIGVVGTLILLLASSLSLVAQDKSSSSDPDNDAVPGVVRVKIARSNFQDQIEPDFFRDAATKYGIEEVSPWLNRGLLRYIDRRSGLYKRNGEGLGGFGRETPMRSLMRIVLVKYSAADSPEEVARVLAAIPGVEYAEPVWQHRLLFVPNDPSIHSEAMKRWHLDAINAYDAWDEVMADSTIVVAITDTGIERDHEDLKEAIWRNPGETGNGKENNQIDDDANGYVDDWWGYDMGGDDGISPDNDPSPGMNDHGVHVAGIVGASGDNDRGVAGVAFGVRLMAVKISDNRDTPSLPGGFEGILYAAAMGADVINCSWGALKGSAAEQEIVDMVVKSMGIPVIAAVGNDSSEKMRYPAGYNNVLSVAATRTSDGRYSRSNYHYNVDISAPGDNIYSTVDGGSYTFNSGTSMATPVVSAAAALLLKKDPTLTPVQISEILRATADNIDLAVGSQYIGRMGSGRLNLAEAVESMTSITSARMTSYTVDEERPDGIIDPDEEVTLRATIENLLAPTQQVVVDIVAIDPGDLLITGTNVDLGPMGSGASAVTPSGSFSFTVPAGTPPDSRIILKVTTVTYENQRNVEYVVLTVFPTYATTELNKIASTFNSTGNVGYNGTNRDQGEGFFFEKEGSLLWHGGLMIGTARDRLVDAVRRGPLDQGTNDGFLMVEPYRLERDQNKHLEIGRASFTDKRDILGIDVRMTTYELGTPDDSNFVIVAYELINRTQEPIDNLHCGLYLDWDLQTNGLDDQANYDPDNTMGFVRNRNNPNLLIGTALISDQTPLYYALDNKSLGVTTQFSDSLKWLTLTNGTTERSTPSGIDISMVIGGGPVRIEAGESETFVFGLLGSKDFAGLRETAERARARYLVVSDVPETGDPLINVRVQALPNPFSEGTIVTVDMPVTGKARLEIVDLHGKSVGVLHDGQLESGGHAFRFDSKDLPSGVYFYRLRGEAVHAEGQVLLVK